MSSSPRSNLIGRRYNALVVVECIVPSRGHNNKGGLWRCLCDCGNDTYVGRGHDLYARDSCGCLWKANNCKAQQAKRKYQCVTLNDEYRKHKSCAQQRGDVPLPREGWEVLVKRPCEYCGKFDVRNVALHDAYQKRGGRHLPKEDISLYEVQMNGVDRVDSSKGYSMDNCVSCCFYCNRMKSDMPLEEFFSQVAEVYHKHRLQEKHLPPLPPS